MLTPPVEFRRTLTNRPKHPTVPEEIPALEAFATELRAGVGENPTAYQLNLARLKLADRYELARRAVPVRFRRTLAECFNRHYADLFDRHLAFEQPDFTAPPVLVSPAPEPPKKPATYAEAVAELYQLF